MTNSGLVLCCKEYVKNSEIKSSMVGSVLTAMIEYSTKTVGLPMTYMELQHVAVALALHDQFKVYCAVVHDKLDGPRFGKMMAHETLAAFAQEYSSELELNKRHGSEIFYPFQHKLDQIVRNCIRPVLAILQSQQGILKAVFVKDNAIMHSTSSVDELGVLANLQTLHTLANNAVSLLDDSIRSMTLYDQNKIVKLYQIKNATLIVVYSKDANSSCDEITNEIVLLLHRILLQME